MAVKGAQARQARAGGRPGGPRRDRSAQKRRTRRLLLDAAGALLRDGETPTADAVAARADVSRRTVYQYFPSQEHLLTEAALEAVRARVDHALALAPPDDAEARLAALAGAVLRSCIESEPLLHAMVRLSLEQRAAPPAAPAAPATPGAPAATRDAAPQAPLRGVRRIEWIERALEPVRARLDRAGFERLVSALAVCVGFEALLVLRDIRGLGLAQMEAVSRWMAVTLLREALAARGEAVASGGTRPGRQRRRR